MVFVKMKKANALFKLVLAVLQLHYFKMGFNTFSLPSIF